MTPADLIDIYGADPARWPTEDRAATLAAIAADPALQAKLAEARALDAMLGDWAARVPARADADAVAARILRPAPRWPRIAGTGGLIAAAVAAVVLVTPPTLAPAPVTTVAATADIEAADDADFATLFTPTPDEESLT
ncbi:hypothetical protein [Glacieibacterium frigidum]|uniref:Uncharacterized protein n=1 Tax=Glacieibacterium frigidum TaxID=2593303 RepID=A0A552UES1_9SPHN|nr:hypothetical protein [Glacieibacterium frigidum]TRW16702.1 hypothetical protein FMM06_00340 [Glacieibacterium frigidum]